MNTHELRALADECALGITYHDRSGPVDEAHAADRLRQAAAALRACADRLEADGWQDIASAPRDGTVILLCDMGYMPFVEVRAGWFNRRNYDFPWRFIDDTREVPFGDDTAVIPNGWQHNVPTHWRPFPELPKDAT